MRGLARLAELSLADNLLRGLPPWLAGLPLRVLNLSDSGLPGYALEGELALPPTLELLRCDAMRGFD